MHYHTDNISHTTTFVTPDLEHWWMWYCRRFGSVNPENTNKQIFMNSNFLITVSVSAHIVFFIMFVAAHPQ